MQSLAEMCSSAENLCYMLTKCVYDTAHWALFRFTLKAIGTQGKKDCVWLSMVYFNFLLISSQMVSFSASKNLYKIKNISKKHS